MRTTTDSTALSGRTSPQHVDTHLHPSGHIDLAPVLRGGMRVAVLAGLVLGASGAATHSIIPTVSIV